ncbi:uncharacterized protein M6B38_293005 [Iris pallida]|uniref:Uncharacterized protein n=1 Tax=Iris pallida TaxID=29817 RepID=A0AAX6HUW9_IRIPA|nr:uncharacterized protein M6B38_293005 [Iris pallida]
MKEAEDEEKQKLERISPRLAAERELGEAVPTSRSERTGSSTIEWRRFRGEYGASASSSRRLPIWRRRGTGIARGCVALGDATDRPPDPGSPEEDGGNFQSALVGDEPDLRGNSMTGDA